MFYLIEEEAYENAYNGFSRQIAVDLTAVIAIERTKMNAENARLVMTDGTRYNTTLTFEEAYELLRATNKYE